MSVPTIVIITGRQGGRTELMREILRVFREKNPDARVIVVRPK